MIARIAWPTWAMTLGMVLWVAGAAVAAEATDEAGEAAAPQKAPTLPDEYAVMVKACGLLADQVEKMAALIEEKKQALAAWDQENGPRLVEIKAALAGALAKQDAEAEAAARADLAVLEKARADLVAQHDAAIQGVMTAQQRATWDGYQLWQSLLDHFKQFTFTEKQSRAIRRIADSAAAQPISDTGDPEAVEKAKQARFDRCVAAVIEKVLTNEQYEVATGQPAPAGRDVEKTLESPKPKPWRDEDEPGPHWGGGPRRGSPRGGGRPD